VAGLLVSVRSAAEAELALAGGAAVIDVKEPSRGPLGRADPAVWRAVRAVTPRAVPVSVALGELVEWTEAAEVRMPVGAFEGMAYRKLGLAGAGRSWPDDWARLRRAWGAGPAWVAVIYADWPPARAPRPEEVLDVALSLEVCAGVLIDTWEKGRPSPVDASWRPLVERIRGADRFVALAGGLDEACISRLAVLEPDLFAVRGAACGNGDREGTIEPARVARLRRCSAP
jgi:uncharacterized protein (UPF0264 family)